MRGLGTDLPRDRCKSIGRDLNVDDEGSKHHRFVGYQSVQHKLTSSRRLIPISAFEKTSKNEEDEIQIVDE
jgi:hypothetical protein